MTNYIEFRDITDALCEYQDKINLFLSLLETERKVFNLTTERVMTSEMILIVLIGGECIGLGGLERKLEISRSIMILKQSCQGKGIGKIFSQRILEKAKQNHNIILAVIEEDNTPSMRMHLSVGYKMVGKRGHLCYLFCPLNTKGLIMYYCIKALFPTVKVLDLIRP
jgi:GNAT superfamily N-acetyltransferase